MERRAGTRHHPDHRLGLDLLPLPLADGATAVDARGEQVERRRRLHALAPHFRAAGAGGGSSHRPAGRKDADGGGIAAGRGGPGRAWAGNVTGATLCRVDAARRGDGRDAVRAGIRRPDACLRQQSPTRDCRADAVRRIRQHGFLAPGTGPDRRLRLARHRDDLRRPPPRRVCSAAPDHAAARRLAKRRTQCAGALALARGRVANARVLPPRRLLHIQLARVFRDDDPPPGDDHRQGPDGGPGRRAGSADRSDAGSGTPGRDDLRSAHFAGHRRPHRLWACCRPRSCCWRSPSHRCRVSWSLPCSSVPATA